MHCTYLKSPTTNGQTSHPELIASLKWFTW